MIFKHGVPILYSTDIRKSLSYYTEVLGFEGHWEWGDPPDFGGVHKDCVEIYFCLEGQGHPGTWISVFVDDVDAYHEAIKSKGAKILCPPQNMEWGVREMLVEDPDGHGIRFGQNARESDREKSSTALPASVRIVARIPSSKETQQLCYSVGWSSSLDPEISSVPPVEIVYAVVAEDVHNKKVIGCVFLYGDSTGFFYVRNLIVDPDWQSKRVGTALMQELTQWLEKNAPPNSTVWLHTPENLGPFYRQFGFMPVFGMMRAIKGHKE